MGTNRSLLRADRLKTMSRGFSGQPLTTTKINQNLILPVWAFFSIELPAMVPFEQRFLSGKVRFLACTESLRFA